MNQIIEKIKNLPNKIFVPIGVGITFLVSLVIVFLVVLPSYSAIGETRGEISLAQEQLDQITANINALEGQDKERLDELKIFMDQLLPDQLDLLHFVTLNEVVAQEVGATVVNVQVVETVAKPAVSTAPGVSTANPGATPTPTTQTSQVAPTSVTVTYASSFSVLLDLVKAWMFADQFVGVKSINVSAPDSIGTVSYTIDYDLPTFSPTTQGALVNGFDLTKEEEETLEKLQTKVVYFASPSATARGKTNPFN